MVSVIIWLGLVADYFGGVSCVAALVWQLRDSYRLHLSHHAIDFGSIPWPNSYISQD